MFSPHKSTSSSVKKSPLPVRVIKWTALQMFSFVLAIILLGVGYAAWQSINSSEITSGQPLTQSLMQKIVGNLDDLNTRLQAINPSGTNLSAGKIQINDVVTEGTTCSSNGLIARNTIGRIVSCQNGKWSTRTSAAVGNPYADDCQNPVVTVTNPAPGVPLTVIVTATAYANHGYDIFSQISFLGGSGNSYATAYFPNNISTGDQNTWSVAYTDVWNSTNLTFTLNLKKKSDLAQGCANAYLRVDFVN